MLTVHLLGYTHVTYQDRPVCLSAKAVALIAYLALEKLPQHRERLADLLWTTAEARKNLRVELARIRAAGLNIFPLSRQLLYLEEVTTDLDLWEARLGADMNQAELAGWLATLRGLPLSGLEDLGSPAFQEWMDQQRWALSERAEAVLARAYWRHEREGRAWATRPIVARAEAVGFEHPRHLPPPAEPETLPVPPPLPEGPPHFEDAARELAIGQALERAAERPQLVVLHGPAGSGKNHLAEHALEQGGWLTITVSNSRMSRLVLATIAMALARECDSDVSERLTQLLLSPGTLEEDVVKVALALASLERPVAIVLDHAQNAPVELASLLEFLMATPGAGPRALLLLSRAAPEAAPLVRSLLRRLDAEQCLRLEMTPPSLTSVRRVLEARFPGEDATALHLRAAVLLQRSEGNLLHLLHLLHSGLALQAPGDRLPEAVRRSYAGEIDGWPAPLHAALSSLSVVNGDFDLALARVALGPTLAPVGEAALREALERRALIEVEPLAALGLPDLNPLPTATWPQGEPRYRFRSEGLRVTLASRVPHAERQEVRRRLAVALASSEPGLALYYAERSGLGSQTDALRRAYHECLPALSPLRALPEAARPSVRPLSAPRRTGAAPGPTVRWQGYLLSWEQGGWLNLVSQGLYGNPHTLKLHLALPTGVSVGAPLAAPLELRIVWRLDVFHGGEELGPTLAPFPLRLGLMGDTSAHVLTSRAGEAYQEEGVTQLTHPDVVLGQWLEHRLSLATGPRGGATLELSVRALDVALTIAELSVGGHSLLPLASTPQSTAYPQAWTAFPVGLVSAQP